MKRSLLVSLTALALGLSSAVIAEEPAPEEAEPSAAGEAPRISVEDPVALRVLVRTAAIREGMPPELADAVARVESSYNPRVVGAVDEIGLMQLRLSTAQMLGYDGRRSELFEPETNIRYGVAYLSQAWRLAGQDICTTVMKYRAGHGETRFSHRSVAYCLRVRDILRSQGYAVTGEVPQATFGETAGTTGAAAAIGATPASRTTLRTPSGPRLAGARRARSRINWAAHDARVREIQARMSGGALRIMQ